MGGTRRGPGAALIFGVTLWRLLHAGSADRAVRIDHQTAHQPCPAVRAAV